MRENEFIRKFCRKYDYTTKEVKEWMRKPWEKIWKFQQENNEYFDIMIPGFVRIRGDLLKLRKAKEKGELSYFSDVDHFMQRYQDKTYERQRRAQKLIDVGKEYRKKIFSGEIEL